MTVALVTGGAGLIGSHLTKQLLKEGYFVIVADDLSRGKEKNLLDIEDKSQLTFAKIDLTEPRICKSLFEGNKDIEEVYHLAAFLGGVEFIQKYPVEAFQKNIRMGTNVLEYANASEVDKVLFTSTACVYPVSKQTTPNSAPLKESDVTPIEPESGYGWAKLMIERLCDSYIKEYGLKVGIVRMFNVYGPGEAYDDGSHVIPMLCRKAIRFPDEEFIVWGNGKATRSFIYATDAVDGILAVMKDCINKGAVNIGTPYRLPIGDLAKLIVHVAEMKYGKKIPIVFDPSKPEGVIGRSADITRASKLTNWKPKMYLEIGLDNTMESIEQDIKENSG